jgi:hypothetical protein
VAFWRRAREARKAFDDPQALEVQQFGTQQAVNGLGLRNGFGVVASRNALCRTYSLAFLVINKETIFVGAGGSASRARRSSAPLAGAKAHR